jgi:hypothetical protein
VFRMALVPERPGRYGPIVGRKPGRNDAGAGSHPRRVVGAFLVSVVRGWLVMVA